MHNVLANETIAKAKNILFSDFLLQNLPFMCPSFPRLQPDLILSSTSFSYEVFSMQGSVNMCGHSLLYHIMLSGK